MINLSSLSDLELAEKVKNSADNPAMLELINRHSGIYYKISSQYQGNPLVDINEVNDNKNFTIYRAALEYDPSKGAFSTFVGNLARYECYGKIHEYRRNHEGEKVELTHLNDKQIYDSNVEYTDFIAYIDKEVGKEDEMTQKIFNSRYFSKENSSKSLKSWRKIAKETGRSHWGCVLKTRNLEKRVREGLKGEIQ